MKAKVKILSSSAGYDLAATAYDTKAKYLNSFEQGKLLPLLGDVVGKKVLDAGAGTGRLAVELARLGAEVTALDASSEMLKILHGKNNHIQTVVRDMEQMPFSAGSFVWVVAAFAIVHLKNPTRFFDECYRVLKPDGSLIVTNINQKEAPLVDTKLGQIKIESFYHRPEQVREELESLAFGIEQEIFIKEAGVWVNQIIIARK
ncbi:MAG: class I SAM-dependent methyltransferase [bacterium]|nr:class I SAM-dependent methyltransferase [bacterium]